VFVASMVATLLPFKSVIVPIQTFCRGPGPAGVLGAASVLQAGRPEGRVLHAFLVSILLFDRRRHGLVTTFIMTNHRYNLRALMVPNYISTLEPLTLAAVTGLWV
jgi:hypothetical protein